MNIPPRPSEIFKRFVGARVRGAIFGERRHCFEKFLFLGTQTKQFLM
jgi:hypothetical protein